ncbi:hypothetical protein EDC18_106138 [Natranaerovirga pectinivora]|uniref:Uncharacterized protein n=1 Tax=Natranaerovirga pectinivora TaxID=682400 RepID=A0A4R3MJP0_9FIRM|nr:hypothetical protein EDC18_106138 [Natranaerovirga pectinivora]
MNPLFSLTLFEFYNNTNKASMIIIYLLLFFASICLIIIFVKIIKCIIKLAKKKLLSE